MRPLIAITAVAVIAATLSWQTTDASATDRQQLARSWGECVRLANARGWTRYREKGRLPFIKRCVQGKVG